MSAAVADLAELAEAGDPRTSQIHTNLLLLIGRRLTFPTISGCDVHSGEGKASLSGRRHEAGLDDALASRSRARDRLLRSYSILLTSSVSSSPFLYTITVQQHRQTR